METAKSKITTAVEEYIRLFPKEYDQFKRSNHIKIDLQKNEWGSTGSSTALERHLYDVPEKLHHAIRKLLTDEELSWFNGRDEYHGTLAGAKWFLETFPQFKITKHF